MTATATTTRPERWVVACGGKEPIMEIEGKRYQYHWEMNSGKRAYYCFEDDMFLCDGLEFMLPRCLTGNP